MKKLISLLLVCCLFAAFAVSAFAAKDYTSYVDEVVIEEGDTLSTICDARGMDYYKVLKAIKIVNGLTDDSALNAIRAGQKYFVPKSAADAETIVKLYDAVVSAVIPASYVSKYTVKSGDTVFSICQDRGLTFSTCQDAILSLNEWSGGKDLTTIYTGQTILFPVNDSAAKQISAAVAKASDMNINVSANSQDTFEFYLVEYTLSSGESIKYAVTQLGIEFTDDIAEKIKGINGLSDLSKVQAGRKYLLPSASSENVKYAIYSHKVVSGDTAAKLCSSMGAEYEKVTELLTALNTKASFPAVKRGAEVLLAAPRGGEQGKTPIVIK